MGDRDEFSAATRKALEDRAGHRCSFPGCQAVTAGPSDESNTSVSHTGMACHIAAAAGGPGARRVRPLMETTERVSIDNGIWMCYTHGRLIDTDEHRFTIPMLAKWREFAESRARFQQAHGADKVLPQNELIKIGLADQALQLSTQDNESDIIGQALLDSCVTLVWGTELCNAVRDVLVEVARNTFIHGGATTCSIIIHGRSIHVMDNGRDFNWLDLPASTVGRGGAAAVRTLFQDFGGKLVLGSKRNNDKNETIIALAHSFDDVACVDPCSTVLRKEDFKSIRAGKLLDSWFPPKQKHCRIVYIILPEFIPHSDAISVSDSLSKQDVNDKQIVFVVSNTSRGVQQYFLKRFPQSRVLCVNDSLISADLRTVLEAE